MTEVLVKLVPVILNFITGFRKPKIQYVDKIEYVDRIKNVEVEVIKEIEKIVEVIVEKIINVTEIEFNKDKILLESIMNNGYDSILKLTGETVMSVGPSGAGKSTICNLIYQTDFKCKSSTADVTIEMSDAIQSPKYRNVKVIDTVGFLPTLENFGKLIILLFHKKQFPDYLLFPIANDRLVDLLKLNKLIELGLIKMEIVPFSCQSYYSNMEILKEMNVDENVAKVKSLNHSFKSSLLNEIKTFLGASGLNGNVKTFESLDTLPVISGSMKNTFLSMFFKDGKFISMTYQEYQNNFTKQDHNTTISIFYGLLLNAIKTLPIHATINNNLIESINEVQFLK